MTIRPLYVCPLSVLTKDKPKDQELIGTADRWAIHARQDARSSQDQRNAGGEAGQQCRQGKGVIGVSRKLQIERIIRMRGHSQCLIGHYDCIKINTGYTQRIESFAIG